MCLRVNQVQWIKAPQPHQMEKVVMKTKLYGRLPQSSSVVWHVGSGWLILPPPWQVVSLHAAEQTAGDVKTYKEGFYTGSGREECEETGLYRCRIHLLEVLSQREGCFSCCWNRTRKEGALSTKGVSSFAFWCFVCTIFFIGLDFDERQLLLQCILDCDHSWLCSAPNAIFF